MFYSAELDVKLTPLLGQRESATITSQGNRTVPPRIDTEYAA
jgi:hypothetical protein